jgi:hypothetical protein
VRLAEFNRGMNPEGISSSSPGLAFFSQPWGEKNQIRNPEKGCVGFELLDGG